MFDSFRFHNWKRTPVILFMYCHISRFWPLRFTLAAKYHLYMFVFFLREKNDRTYSVTHLRYSSNFCLLDCVWCWNRKSLLKLCMSTGIFQLWTRVFNSEWVTGTKYNDHDVCDSFYFVVSEWYYEIFRQQKIVFFIDFSFFNEID